MSGRLRPRSGGRGGVIGLSLGLLIALAVFATPARAANPLFTFTPTLPPPPANPVPPPTGHLNGPCGLVVDSTGRFYIADHYHDRVHVYSPSANYSSPSAHGGTGYQGQLSAPDTLGGPCALAMDASDNLYVNSYHRGVRKYGAFGSFGAGAALFGATQVTGIAVDKSSGDVYVNEGTQITVYDSGGTEIDTIGSGELGDAYGVAVSGFSGSPSTDGYVYVPDASSNTVKVFDAAGTLIDELTDRFDDPFVSLREASIAIDDLSGEVYFTDNLQPEDTEQPEAIVYAYGPDGNWDGYLRDRIVTALPAGLAVDNSGTATQGRIYVASGNTHRAGIYAYPAGAATPFTHQAPVIPGAPRGGGDSNSSVSIGESSNQILCSGDACQLLPPTPGDPTLTTLLEGPGNPKIRYRNTNCTLIARAARNLRRKGQALSKRSRRVSNRRQSRKLRNKARQLKRKSARRSRAARNCRRAKRGGSASASASASASTAGSLAGGSGSNAGGGSLAAATHDSSSVSEGSLPSTSFGGATTQGLLPGAGGFSAEVLAAGAPATQAGSHPYRMSLSAGLDQSGGSEHLRSVRFDLPSGFLINPAVLGFCPNSSFLTNRSSPYFSSESGEDCHQLFQAGTIDVTTGIGGGETRRFGVYHLIPSNDGVAMRFGAAPFGHHLRFDATLSPSSADGGLSLSLSADVPSGLQAESMRLTLWGTPWDESHNTERGDCLNEEDPAFGFSRCSVGEPTNNSPLAMLTLPTVCGDPLAFELRAESTAGTFAAQDEGPLPVSGCNSLNFNPDPLGILTTEKASSPSGFVFRLDNDDFALTDPRVPIRSHPKKAVVELPDGVTINPSLGAGLGVCSPSDYAEEETLASSASSGCPADSKIGDFLVQTPYYDGTLRGSIFLAKPRDNPFDSLLAVYLVARSPERGILIRLPGELTPDPGDGTITATFDGLPQLPYTNLDIVFRTGQRAPLISPPRCGNARTKITISPWAQGAPTDVTNRDSEINSGIDAGPCPDNSPPFSPEIVTGGVNSNVGSYTPYYVRISRKDTEQEITSYSLELPRGVTGKLAGIPFCSEGAIAAARNNDGFDEIANPSCPSASQVGTTNTSYGVGDVLTYAPGRIYLAGPYQGEPLSLVTINAATVGPFDLGTIVIRSAFSVNPRTAQLEIERGSSDPIPHILEGIPLHLRDVRITMDRFQFTRNPSSCLASQMVSTITGSGNSFSTSADDSFATVSRHFQLLNCLELGFQPKLGIQLLGQTARNGNPALRAVLRARPGDASMKRMTVDMPPALFLAQNHIRQICTRPQFNAERCPNGSIYGRAVVYSSLFDEPLKGPVFLRSSNNRLPDLVASLRSGEIRIVLEGRIGPTGKGGVRAFFDNVPDAPIEAFVMQLNGGKRGLLANSVNICNRPPTASVKGLGQNHLGSIFTTKLRGRGCKKANRKRGRGRNRARNRNRNRRARRSSQPRVVTAVGQAQPVR